MRTTITLPDDLHRQAMSIARDTSRSFSDTVADLLRRALGAGRQSEVSTSARTGLPNVQVGRVITSEDVRRLEDDE